MLIPSSVLLETEESVTEKSSHWFGTLYSQRVKWLIKSQHSSKGDWAFLQMRKITTKFLNQDILIVKDNMTSNICKHNKNILRISYRNTYWKISSER
jgi:hypothetical protein